MELIITEKNPKPTICLNMIVKDESHIIESTLTKLCSKISFDYWVICDTGSTDNTPSIIDNFFKKLNIPGELYHNKWEDFAHNRTLALEYAYNKTDLLLVFDADDEIVGTIKMPDRVNFDQYHLKFGNPSGTTYTRVLLINNRKKFQYLSVIHEFITCKEPNPTSNTIDGDYFVISGRSGSRNKDPDKYYKDALILEKAHGVALKTNDPLHLRYAFYCANSYKDCGRFEEAIKWYKITLSQNNWGQEKYMSCFNLFNCYKSLNKIEEGYYWLVRSFMYDNERLECLYELLVHYCCENSHSVAYSYYNIVKQFYENKYFNTGLLDGKLFTDNSKYDFYVPYYMVLIADKMKDYDTVIKMYEMVFKRKIKIYDEWYIKNLLYNIQFFFKHLKDNTFVDRFNDYLLFLSNIGIQLQNYDFLKNYSEYNVNVSFIFKDNLDTKKFSKKECEECTNILFYTGFANEAWNYSFLENNAIGGSEKAVAYLSKEFSKHYNIYVSGQVKNEKFDNITYVSLDKLKDLIDTTPFNTVIISRYVGFLEMFPQVSTNKIFIWAHDTSLLPYGCKISTEQIFNKWNKEITGCICLTEWHANLFKEKYPILKDKISIINNGINIELFKSRNKKLSNKFIYSSCPERGLSILLNLWEKIIEEIPDAELVIAGYTNFPKNEEEDKMKEIIDKHESITYLGKLSPTQLYEQMSSSEYWLYPCTWPETSCITALEMLMSEVICLCYPTAGLPYTLNNHYIQIQTGDEIQKLRQISIDTKNKLKTEGKNYAKLCTWKNRAQLWENLISSNTIINSNTSINSNIVSTINKEPQNSTRDFDVDILDMNACEIFEETEDTNIVMNENDKITIEEKNDTEKILSVEPNIDNIINYETNKEETKVTNDNDLWCFFAKPHEFIFEVTDDYFKSLKQLYNIQVHSNFNEMLSKKPSKISFINVFDETYKNIILKDLPNCVVSLLNLEPLNLQCRMDGIINVYKTSNGSLTIYDYSQSNIQLLNDNNIHNTVHLPYNVNLEETTYLRDLLKKTKKEYDFGIITGCGSKTNNLEELGVKRKEVVKYLLDNNYKVNIIKAWGQERDIELAKCKIIINIHGQIPGHGNWIDSKIFENLRCDRLIAAGFKILSEKVLLPKPSSDLENYSNLKFISFSNFFKIPRCISPWYSLDIFTSKNKIIDCFTFYNEFDLLKYRLELLYDIVDHFILVEARQTHVGKNKPLYFNMNKHTFQKYMDKIVHIIVDLPIPFKDLNGRQWTNEKHQRNCIKLGLEKIELNHNDKLIIADVDEIPDPTTILKIKPLNNFGIYKLEQDFYYYNLNSKRHEKWYHSKILSYDKYIELNCDVDSIRFISCDIIPNGGWHLSYFGNTKFIKNKLENFAHQEYNLKEITDEDKIASRIEKCDDLFGREGGNKMLFIDINENSYLPPNYDIHLQKYYSLENKTLKIPNLIRDREETVKIKKNKPAFCFIHSCTTKEQGRKRLDYIIESLFNTECYKIFDKIFINNIGLPIENIYGDNFEVNNYSTDITLCEIPTINRLLDFSINSPEDAYICYLHSKGVLHQLNDMKILDWIDFLLYFTVHKYEVCLKALDNGYDTVGCNFIPYSPPTSPYPSHYSGNFWWSRTNHTKQLKKIGETNINRHDAEFWLCGDTNPKVCNLHMSRTNHYQSRYPKENYIDSV